MALRCLLFSSDEGLVQPIWQVLNTLGIEGEYCQSAVDAVEKVTTQSFQIVITDWDNQPEAAFLLKTARELKAAQRPLTLAIVSDDARLPEALRAGANSVLAKPIRPEQVRDTMSTACQLLRAKQQSAGQVTPTPQMAPQTVALAAVASTGAIEAPASVTQAPEKIRTVEFPKTPKSAPDAQFGKDAELESPEEPTAGLEVLTESEPIASPVDSARVDGAPAEEPGPQEPLTGWAMLQARLTKSASPKPESAPAKSELLSYGETPSHGTTPAAVTEEHKVSAKVEPSKQGESEAALFAYVSGESEAGVEPAPKPRSKRGLMFVSGVLAVVCVALEAAPPTRQSLKTFYLKTVRAGSRLLNPPPAPLPQAVALHDSFGQSGDEYKLPVPANIPDATTDPSQIQVLPVLDPTAKPDKNAAANGQTQGTSAETPMDQNQSAPDQGAQPQVEQRDPATPGVADAPQNPTAAAPVPAPVQIPVQTPTAAAQTAVAPPQGTAPARSPLTPHPHPISSSTAIGIRSSLKSQTASTTPESSGTKPLEAAMSSIEPVSLPEATVRELLAQPVDPEYPAAAKASGQRGIVILQVLITRDGTVQEAKFLQGSLVFARVAIDAVRQWRFKPYSMNGRVVSVQSFITLTFKPPA